MYKYSSTQKTHHDPRGEVNSRLNSQGHSILPNHLHSGATSFFYFPYLPPLSLSLSMSSKAHYLLGSLIDYKRLVLFPRNMPLKRTEYTFRRGHRRWTENAKRESENSLSLSSNEWKTLSTRLHLSVSSFILSHPSSLCLSSANLLLFPVRPETSPYTYLLLSFAGFPRGSSSNSRISSRFPLLFISSTRPFLRLPSLIMPTESSPVPTSTCLQGQLISSTGYYEYSRFSFSSSYSATLAPSCTWTSSSLSWSSSSLL